MTQVRPAREQDAEVLAALERATWTTTTSPAPVPVPVPVLERPSFGPDQHPADVLVAEQDGLAVDSVRLAQALEVPSHAHVLEVQGLAVAPAQQGRGTGRLLLEAAVRLARERGAWKLSLRVLGHNAPARRLDEACGFVAEGIARGSAVFGGIQRDELVMSILRTEWRP